MDETKQNDTADWGETGPFRIPRPDEGEVSDIICAVGHAYQVVHAQESTWMFYLRLTTIDGKPIGIIRVIPWSGSNGLLREGTATYDFHPGGVEGLK